MKGKKNLLTRLRVTRESRQKKATARERLPENGMRG